jgi:hypothetical protein
MAADDAPCRGAEDAVMTGKVPGRAADQGTFNATFGIGRGRHAHSRKRNRGKSNCSFHRVLLVAESTMLGGDLRSDGFSRYAGFAGVMATFTETVGFCRLWRACDRNDPGLRRSNGSLRAGTARLCR